MQNTKTKLDATVCDNVRRFRKLANLTQAELAARAGSTQDHISDIERGATRPTLGTIDKLSTAMGVTLADLIENRY